MLQLKHNGQYFDLPANTTVSMELNNPIFDEDLIKGSYSFPFKFPLTPGNRRKLGFPDEINNILPFQRNLDGVILMADGIPMFSGQLIMRRIENQMVDAYLLVGNSAVNEYATNSKLADLVDFKLSFADPAALKGHMAATTSGTVDQFPYVFFPVANVYFYRQPEREYDESVPTIQNRFMGGEFKVEEQLEKTSDLAEKYPLQAITPFPYITYLLRAAFHNHKFSLNIFELDAELKTLVLYSNTGLARFVKEMVFGIEYWINKNDRSIDLKTHIPDMSVADLIIGLKNIFCLYFYVSLSDGRLEFGSLKDLMSRPVEIDWTAKAEPTVDIFNDFLPGLRYIPDYEEDMAKEELIQSIKGFPIRPFSQAPILPVLDDPNLYYYEGQGYYKSEKGYLLYKFYSREFTDYYLDDDPLFEIKARITPLMMKNIWYYEDFFNPANPGFFLTSKNPYVKLPGKYYDREEKINNSKVSPRVTFYRGIQADIHGHSYPMGSSDNFDQAGNVIPGKNYSMAWDGQYGLYSTWWKQYVNMRHFGRKVVRQVRLTHTDLASLDFTRKIRVENANYIIKKINLDLPLRRPVKVEFWKVD